MSRTCSISPSQKQENACFGKGVPTDIPQTLDDAQYMAAMYYILTHQTPSTREACEAVDALKSKLAKENKVDA